MIQYNKQNKNGNPIIVKITHEYYLNGTYVRCSLYQPTTIKIWFKNRDILNLLKEKDLSIHVVNQWTCNQFEEWADGVIKEYDNGLTEKENNEKTLNLIINGCKTN